MNEVDRHDLDALKELMVAKFDGVDRTLKGMEEALRVAAVERSVKDAELNEVRQRFVDRITHDSEMDGLKEIINKLEKKVAFYSGAAAVAGAVAAILVRLLTLGG